MKNIAQNRIPNQCILNKFNTMTCTSIPQIDCGMQPVTNYWHAIVNLLHILGLNVFLNQATL